MIFHINPIKWLCSMMHMLGLWLNAIIICNHISYSYHRYAEFLILIPRFWFLRWSWLIFYNSISVVLLQCIKAGLYLCSYVCVILSLVKKKKIINCVKKFFFCNCWWWTFLWIYIKIFGRRVQVYAFCNKGKTMLSDTGKSSEWRVL